MSDSPSKEVDVEPGAQSPDEDGTDNRKSMDATDTQGQGLDAFEVKEQDRWLPIANVARIMKTALPENAKIAKEAKECMQECVSEFISFITSEASEKCQQEKRKTVNGEDILFAMTSLGFENYSEALKIYLSKYRETQSSRGENSNRATGVYGGTAAAQAAANNQSTTSPTAFHQPTNNVMNAQGDVADHDPSVPFGYGNPVMGSAHAHNPGTGDGY